MKLSWSHQPGAHTESSGQGRPEGTLNAGTSGLIWQPSQVVECLRWWVCLDRQEYFKIQTTIEAFLLVIRVWYAQSEAKQNKRANCSMHSPLPPLIPPLSSHPPPWEHPDLLCSLFCSALTVIQSSHLFSSAFLKRTSSPSSDIPSIHVLAHLNKWALSNAF